MEDVDSNQGRQNNFLNMDLVRAYARARTPKSANGFPTISTENTSSRVDLPANFDGDRYELSLGGLDKTIPAFYPKADGREYPVSDVNSSLRAS